MGGLFSTRRKKNKVKQLDNKPHPRGGTSGTSVESPRIKAIKKWCDAVSDVKALELAEAATNMIPLVGTYISSAIKIIRIGAEAASFYGQNVKLVETIEHYVNNLKNLQQD